MREETVEFKIGEEILKGSLFIPGGKGPFPGVVFYHGRGSKRERYLEIARRLAEKGILTLAFDFRGCGESDGIFEEQSHLNGINDAKAGLEFLLKQNVDKNRIGILGTSFGGYVTGMLLPEYSFVKSIVLRVPAAYSDSSLNSKGEVVDEYFQDEENWIDSSAYKNIRDFKGDLLIIKCEIDGLLPDKMVEKYYKEAVNAKKRELYILKGADHKLIDAVGLEEFFRKAEEWFGGTLG